MYYIIRDQILALQSLFFEFILNKGLFSNDSHYEKNKNGDSSP